MRLVIYLLLLSITGSFFSCYDDKSNMDYTLLKSINIDVSDLPNSFEVSQYGRLKIAPLIYKQGIKDQDLSFKWELKGDGMDKEIGKGMVLDTIIDDAPQTVPYTILLTVTDNTTGISELKTWKLTILNQLREGLVVVDTRDGIHSDISLIMAYNFTGQPWVGVYREDSVVRNLYSRTNGSPVNDLALGVQSTSFSNNRTMTLLCQKSLLRINPYTYVYEYDNNDLFYAPFNDESEIRPEKIYYDQWYREEILLMNGLIYRRRCQNGETKYNYQFTVANNKYAITQACLTYADNSTKPRGFVYDDLNHRFLKIPYSGETLGAFTNNISGKFDPNNMGNMECLFMDESMNRKVYAVMHERNTANYYIYPLQANTADNGSAIALTPIDISSCQDIAKAKYFATSTKEDVLYYATEDKLYVAILTTTPIQSHVRYPLANAQALGQMANEEITSMQIWKDAAGCVLYPGDYGEYDDYTAFRMLLVTTCDANGNGRVITMPIQYLGIGGLADPSYFRTFSGFGRILAARPQIK